MRSWSRPTPLAPPSPSAAPPRSSTRRAAGSIPGRSSARPRPTWPREGCRRSLPSPARFWAGLPATRWRSRPLAGPATTASSGSSRSPALEDQPEVVQQLALEGHAVCADPRGESEAGVGAREPARGERQLHQVLPQARLPEPRAPLADGLDVVQPAALTRHELEVGLG